MLYLLKIQTKNISNSSQTVIKIEKNVVLTTNCDYYTCICGVTYKKPKLTNINCVISYLWDPNTEISAGLLNRPFKLNQTSQIHRFASYIFAGINSTDLNKIKHQINYCVCQ